MINRDKQIGSWYERHYHNVNVSGRNKGFFAKYIHTILESTNPFEIDDRGNLTILEVGSNGVEHLEYVREKWAEYLIFDLREVEERALPVMESLKAKFVRGDVHSLPFPEESLDRVVSTCLFHHLHSPEIAMSELRRVVRPGGVISILLPHDPGALYRFTRYLTSGLIVRRRNLVQEEKLYFALDHRNHFLSLKTILLKSFDQDEVVITHKPFPWSIYDFNLFSIFHIRKK